MTIILKYYYYGKLILTYNLLPNQAMLLTDTLQHILLKLRKTLPSQFGKNVVTIKHSKVLNSLLINIKQ